MRARLLRTLALATFFVVLAFAALCARAIVEGESEMSASDAAFDKGALLDSVEHARRSATAYVPGAPHVARAYERLNAIAVGAEAAGQVQLAYAAWQAVRSAAFESRHLSTPHRAELAYANQNLARLEALLRNVEDDDRAKQQQQALKRLEHDSSPASGWLLVLGVSFCAVLAGLAWFALKGLDAGGRVVWSRAGWGLLLVGLGAACWTLAVLRA